MKRAIKFTAILALVICLPLGVYLFHLGPFGIHPGDDVVLAHCTLANDARLYVVAHRTQSLTEPYEVTLYRKELGGEVFTYWLGYEDSFWWGCSIRSAESPFILQIRADGSVAAVYDVQDHSVTFPDGHYHYGVQTGRSAATNTVPLVIVQNGR